MQEAENREEAREVLIERYKEHMRQVLHHQQEAYFCMVEILSNMVWHKKAAPRGANTEDGDAGNNSTDNLP